MGATDLQRYGLSFRSEPKPFAIFLVDCTLYHHLDIPAPGRPAMDMHHDPDSTRHRKLKHVVSDFVESETYRDIKQAFAIFRDSSSKRGMVAAWNDVVQHFGEALRYGAPMSPKDALHSDFGRGMFYQDRPVCALQT